MIARLTPIVRSLVSIPSGSASVKFVPFVLFTTIGSLIWNSVLVELGATAFSYWNNIVNSHTYSSIAWLAFVALAIFVIFGRKRIRKKKQPLSDG
ncbi:DedA family protein [Cohnella yongneupensis]|uniref:DedA family protein n=1 Tax=Cohnella yongneupensis TaxID=425006 RepID=A0ABW0R191_9BACL